MRIQALCFKPSERRASFHIEHFNSILRRNKVSLTLSCVENKFSPKVISFDSGCGGPLTSESGFVYSPNYPNSYDPHDDCTWTISVQPGHTVKLQFLDFDLEPSPASARDGSTQSCPYDYVAIYDGPTTSANVIAKVVVTSSFRLSVRHWTSR